METVLRIDMLGQLCVAMEGRSVQRFRTHKTAALLAYLAFYRERSHPRDALVELFWPDSALDAARSNLSVALNALKNHLLQIGAPANTALIADRSHIRLNPDLCQTDVDQFLRLAREAEQEADQRARIDRLERALALYRGDLLPGFYDDWIFTERELLRDTYLSSLSSIAKALIESRQFEPAIEFVHRIVQAAPLRESAYMTLMRLYVRTGRPEAALGQFRALEDLLERELHTIPSEPIREFAARIPNFAPPTRPLNSVVPSAISTPSPKVNGDRPQAPEAWPHRIPVQFTRFFGRESELDRITSLLGPQPDSPDGPGNSSVQAVTDHSNSPRLVTVTGPGGTGKTRLSIEATTRVKQRFSGGIWFVPLADLLDATHLGEAIRDFLDLPRQASKPAIDQITDYLNGRDEPALIVLDNFEQITAGGAPVIWTLLSRSPRLRCLITSRRLLSLPGEREVSLDPLPIPGVAQETPQKPALVPALLTYPSIALFVDRAQSVRSDFQITATNATVIAEICRKLEGIPLAIELTAARMKALAPAQILERLAAPLELTDGSATDRPERHRSLWAAIDWSYNLLPNALKRLFTRLSIFRGGWTLEAAEEVCQEPDALEYLSQLRGHSLILASESATALRFRMLDTIREFAGEQLVGDEAAGLARRHADYFQKRVTGLTAPGTGRNLWSDGIEEDLDNLRAALSWSLEPGSDIEAGLEIAGSMVSFWRVRGHLQEGREWYARLLERAGPEPTVPLAWCLYGAAALAALSGDFQVSAPLLERCRLLAGTLGDEPLLATVHSELGNAAYRRGDPEQARAHYQVALELARQIGSQPRIASALTNLASVAQITGRNEESLALNGESLELWREIGDGVGEARTLHNLANASSSAGLLEEARGYYEQSLAIKRELADHFGISSSLAGLAEVAIQQNDYAAAIAYARESLAMARENRVVTTQVEILHIMVEAVSAHGEHGTAAALYGALERAREELDYPMSPVDREQYERKQADLQCVLGKQKYQEQHTEGWSMSLDEALGRLEQALEEISLALEPHSLNRDP